jgi:hypothetical protein
MTTSQNIKFMDNQTIQTGMETLSIAENPTYPFSNCLDPVRSRVYRPGGVVFNVEWDLGVSTYISFVGIVGPQSEVFSVSPGATITLEGNNIPVWTSPPYSTALIADERGILKFLETGTPADTTFRYWRLVVDDTGNPNDIQFGYLFMGNHLDITERNVRAGFAKTQVDPTTELPSNNGTRFFDRKPSYTLYSGLGLSIMPAADRRNLEQLGYDFGIDNPLFVSLDPGLNYSNSLFEMTRLAFFPAIPRETHFYSDRYSMAFDLREAI